MSQDTLRTKVYQENINNCDVYLDLLETYHAQLKENSFGNQLLKSILAGISEGLKQAAVKSINASSLNIGKNSHSTAMMMDGITHLLLTLPGQVILQIVAD